MRVVSAYLLALLGGKSSPTAADIEKILGSVGIEAEKSNIDKLLGEMKGKDVLEVIARGREKLAAVPSGGGAVVASGGGGGGAAAAGGAAVAAEEKPADDEPDKKSESESDEDMGMSLFD